VRKTGSRPRTPLKTRKKSKTPGATNEKCSDEFTPEQWERIRTHIRTRGMTFEVFLPELLADWLRKKLAGGVFKNPGEAAFVAFQDLRELDRHPAVRKALLKAMINSSADDPHRGISFEEWRKQHQAQLRRYADSEPPSK
jgi:hypothetical protein